MGDDCTAVISKHSNIIHDMHDVTSFNILMQSQSLFGMKKWILIDNVSCKKMVFYLPDCLQLVDNVICFDSPSSRGIDKKCIQQVLSSKYLFLHCNKMAETI